MHEEPATADLVDPGGGSPDRKAVLKTQLITVELSDLHKTDGFLCTMSPRVAGFFANEARQLIPSRFCKAFIAPDPNDPTAILGFYTLSSAQLRKENVSGGDEKRLVKSARGFAPPMIRIGFMGKDDRVPKGFGTALLIDAARRIYVQDIGAWGIVLEPENGTKNDNKLWQWYQKQGFKACREMDGTAYIPLSALLPELQGGT
jgi:hypothetical protein